MLTVGVDTLPSDVRAMAIRETETFDAFTSDNDPRGEHDFGNFEVGGKGSFGKSITTTARSNSASTIRATRRRQPACSPSCSRRNTERSESVVSNRASEGARFFLLPKIHFVNRTQSPKVSAK